MFSNPVINKSKNGTIWYNTNSPNCIISEFVSVQVKSIRMDDGKRKSLVYLPKAYRENQNNSFQVVFNFHGGGITAAEEMLAVSLKKHSENSNLFFL